MVSIKDFFKRNKYYKGNRFYKDKINLLFWDKANIGDQLSPVVLNWMLERKGLTFDSVTKQKFAKLSCIGSVFSFFLCDRVVWGSGFAEPVKYKFLLRKLYKFDIRAVRGPLSHKVLLENGLINEKTNIVYGDPAILMPMIYNKFVNKEYDTSIILHINDNRDVPVGIHKIDVKTSDYYFFIDEIRKSKLIISSSLHGIILAESYGIPCIWLKTNINDFKFFDYFESTERNNLTFYNNVEEAINGKPNELPNLDEMRKKIISVFPYDLWK